ncbi:MAG: response regulator [Chloroflexota bacterium]
MRLVRGERLTVVQGARILIVDDDASIRDLLSQALDEEGYHVLTATNGRDAVRQLEDGRMSPDLMILDLVMPEMTGWQVFEHLRGNLLQQFPVLILSAQRPDESILEALDAELRDFVSKPFNLDELLIRTQALLRRSPRFAMQARGILRIYALGALRVYRDDTLLFDESWRNKPAKTIFKLLFTNSGQRYPKDVLAEELWPETDPGAAANRLRVAVHELRKVLVGRRKGDKGPSHIGQQEGAYYFDPSLPYWSDVQDFEEFVQQGGNLTERENFEGALEAFRRAEALYQADYLRDDPFLEWTIATRERLREDHLTMLAAAAHILARQGDPAEAAGFCRKILRIEPWREEVYRHLMEYLNAAGRAHEALRAFEECRRALHQEIEAEPSHQTIALRDRIAGAREPRAVGD